MLEKVVREGVDVSKIRSPVLRNYMGGSEYGSNYGTSDTGYNLSKKKGGGHYRETRNHKGGRKHNRTTWSRKVTPCSFFWP